MSGSFTDKYRFLHDQSVPDVPFKLSLDDDRCIGCGLCLQQCPCQTLSLVERPYSKKQEAACQFNCPSGIDIRKYMKILSGGGSYREVWEEITKANPLPAVTGMICPHPCEDGCNRQYLDESLNINQVERFIGLWAIGEKTGFRKPDFKSGRHVAVIGSGPAGMSCAYHLALMGHEVTIYEAESKPGGILQHTIPSYRLPKDIVQAEIQRILDLGVTLKLNTKIGEDTTVGELQKNFDAVYIAIGAQKSVSSGIADNKEINIISGIDFLRSVEGKSFTGKRIIVVGGGNTAIDAARSAKRTGADVTIIYRRTQSEMPAHEAEVLAAEEEGVKIEYQCAPIKTLNNGKVICQKMSCGDPDDSGRARPVPVDGSDFEMNFDILIEAIGQELSPSGFEKYIGKNGWINTDDSYRTSQNGVFAGGDARTGPQTVTAAIGAGRIAALSIDASLNGEEFILPQKKEISFRDVPQYGKKLKRNSSPEISGTQSPGWLVDPASINLKPDQAADEASRCMDCGKCKSVFTGSISEYFPMVCLACRNCEAICPHDALGFPNYYRIEKGRYSNSAMAIPEPGRGYPNPFMEKTPPPFKDIENIITETEKVIFTRRSNRVFNERTVPRETVHRILEAGRFAPSAGNSQPWRFIVVRDRAFLDEISRECVKILGKVTRIYQKKNPLSSLLKKGLALALNGKFDQRPMVAMQALLTPQFREGEMDVFFGTSTVIFVLTHYMGISEPVFGTGMCCQNIALAAHSLGLGTCYAGFAAEPVNLSRKLQKKLGVKWPYTHVATAIVVGYPSVQIDKAVEREFPPVEWVE